MTVKEIKAMFAVGERWRATVHYAATGKTLATDGRITTRQTERFAIEYSSPDSKAKEVWFTFPRKPFVREAAAGYLVYENELGNHITLEKVA